MVEKIKGISIDDQEESLIESFGVDTEELNDKFRKFMVNEFDKILEKNKGKENLEVKPIEITKSYLKEFTLQEIGAMAATEMFEKFNDFIKSSLEFVVRDIKDELKTDFNTSLI